MTRSRVRAARLLGLVVVVSGLSACVPPGMSSLDGLTVIQPASSVAERDPAPATIPIMLVSQRILIEVTFEAPNGRGRKALAWINMGMSSPIIGNSLYHELGLDQGAPLRFHLGGFAFNVPAGAVSDGSGGLGGPDLKRLFAPRSVEVMLPSGLFQQFVLTLDYQHRALTLARPGQALPDGDPVACAINSKTGLVGIEATIDEARQRFVIDAGGGYSWVRGDVVAHWLRRHPDWGRTRGAIGPSNANMLDLAFEKDGTVARIPAAAIGSTQLEDFGIMGTGPILGETLDGVFGNFFWDNWEKSAPYPVIGWIGGNVLRHYKLTIDYPNRMTYWRKLSESDPHELDQIGVTLVRRGDRYFIGGFVRKFATNEADGVLTRQASIGDELLAVDGKPVPGLSMDAVLLALHSRPEEKRQLLLGHNGSQMVISAHAMNNR